MTTGKPSTETVWTPQPGPQKALIDCQIREVFYGGARGGGKTDGVLGKYAIKGERFGKWFNAIFFRRELPAADDAIERSHEIFGRLGWQYNATKYIWRSPAGARLRFRPLERVSDAEKYQGQNITDACVEEAGQYADPKPIDRLNGVLRSAHSVPVQLLLTGNPGGAGQAWLRERYVDPAPMGMRVLRRLLRSGREHRYVFIPSRLQNNRFLGDDYVDGLHLVGSEALVRAWLDGDWGAVEGAFFDCWRTEKHVVRPFTIPTHWLRFGSFDWGSASPFSMGWWAIASEDHAVHGRVIPKGAMVRYREWYGAQSANVGLKLTNNDIADGILKCEDGDKMAYRVADPSIFKEDGGPSIAEQLAKGGVWFGRADNRRTGAGPIAGWSQMRDRLLGHGSNGNEPGVPMLYCFSTCMASIRTIPVLQHSEINAEDLDTDGEDHAADEWRYACMSRPWIMPASETAKPRVLMVGPENEVTLNDMWAAHSGQNRRKRV